VLSTPYKRLLAELRSLSSFQKAAAALWVPIIRVTGDLAKMAGYPVGVVWRLRRRGQLPDWRAVDPAQVINS
jgi:hypothetical protein